MPVVIVDANGQRHVFPDGMDPKKAAAIVRGQSQPEAAPKAEPSPALPDDEEGSPSMLQRVGGVLASGSRTAAGIADEVVKGTLQNIPGRVATELTSPVQSKTTWETPLASAGMKEGPLRTVAGVAGDIVLDPTWFLPTTWVGKVGTAAKAFDKALTGGKTAAGLAKGVAKTAEFMEPATALVKQYPGTAKLIGRSGTSAEDHLRLNASAIEAAKSMAEGDIAKIFKDVSQADRVAIAHYLDDPKTNPLTNPALAKPAADLKAMLDTQFQTEVGKGVSNAAKKYSDYIPYVMPTLDDKKVIEIASKKGTSKFSQKRSFDSLKEAAQFAGAEEDAAIAATARIAHGQRAVKNVEFVETMAKEFGHTGPNVPAGYRVLNTKKFKLPDTVAAAHQETYFPAKLVDQMEKTHLIYAKPTGPEALVRNINKQFKNIVTTWNPAHHANNMQGNVVLMELGDMNPVTIGSAYRLKNVNKLHSMMDNAPNAATVGKEIIEGTKLTMQEAFDAARGYNLFGSSEGAIELSRALGKEKGKFKQASDKIRLETSRFVEDPAKWGMFLDQLKKGKTPEQAAIHTKNFLFDYNELTDFEKGIRDYGMVPFYTWMRKNLPLQMSAAVKTPARMSAVQKAYSTPERLGGKDILGQPDYMTEEGYVPQVDIKPWSETFGQGVQNEDGAQEMMRLANPQLDLNKLGSVKAMLGGALGPVPRMAIERITGNDLRTGRPLKDKLGMTTASPLGALASQASMALGGPPVPGVVPTMEGFKQGGEAAYWMSQIPNPLIPYVQRMAGAPAEQIGTALETPVGKKLLNILMQTAGLSTRNLTMEQQVTAAKEMIEKMRNEIELQKLQMKGEAIGDSIRGK